MLWKQLLNSVLKNILYNAADAMQLYKRMYRKKKQLKHGIGEWNNDR